MPVEFCQDVVDRGEHARAIRPPRYPTLAGHGVGGGRVSSALESPSRHQPDPYVCSYAHLRWQALIRMHYPSFCLCCAFPRPSVLISIDADEIVSDSPRCHLTCQPTNPPTRPVRCSLADSRKRLGPGPPNIGATGRTTLPLRAAWEITVPVDRRPLFGTEQPSSKTLILPTVLRGELGDKLRLRM